MARTGSRSTEVALPAASLAALRRALIEEVGADATARALQRAGHAAGDEFHALLSANGGASTLAQGEFWRRLNELFAVRGWGQLLHELVHPGIGALDSSDWAEAGAAEGASRPSCFFTTGLLANLLGRTAGQEIAVLEVECRARGDSRCRFLFGSPANLESVFAGLAAGRDVAGSIAELR